MSYKNRITIILIGICAFALFVSGTFAYFTSTATATSQNIVSTTVEIEISEYTLENGERIPLPAEGFENVMPSQKVSKIVEIKNVGGTDAWIRVKADATFKVGENTLPSTITVGSNSEKCIIIAPNENDWELMDDGYYYCEASLADGDTVLFIEEAQFNNALPNEYADANANLTVRAEAVQSNYNGTSAADATGWPEP